MSVIDNNLIEEYKKKGYELSEMMAIRSGKEATVFCVKNGEKLLALKVYEEPEYRSFQDNKKYLEGKYYKQHSVRKAISKGNAFSKKYTHNSWVRREFSLLTKLQQAGMNVPKVYECVDASILMDYIGDNENAAPRLIDVVLEKDDAVTALKSILKDIQIFIEHKIVHGDLSAYNILWWNKKPYVIDFPQSVDIAQNPNAQELFQKDIDNIKKYFGKILDMKEYEHLFPQFIE